MNKLYTLLALAAAGTLANAAPRTLQEARILAEQELSVRLGHKVTLSQQLQRASKQIGPTSDAEQLPYYNFSTDEAFVFISGSDLLPAVIGYGECKDLDDDCEMPINMLGYLEQVAEVEAYLESDAIAAMAQINAMSSTTATTPISPIMTCKWGQDYPYNNLCPTLKNGTQTVVGCVATALSQIIYTQKFPNESHGEIDYKNHGTTTQASLEGVTYDFSLMYDKHDENNSDQENNEVAKLCHNVGLSCMMQYGSQSAAISLSAQKGMIENFGMTKASIVMRCYYALDEWNKLLQDELQDGNPIFFSAQSSAGGHAFVIDGLDNKGYYHVNWGWDGNWDGFFDISLLRTNGAGTGASENGGFYLNQEAMLNLYDPDKVTRWYSPLGTYRDVYYTSNDKISCKPTTGIQRGTKLTLSATAVNNYSVAYSGKTGVLVMKDGETFDQVIGSKTYSVGASKVKLDNQNNFIWYPSEISVSADYTLPADLSDGTYRLYLVAQSPDETTVDAIRQYHYSPSYWKLTVNGDNLTLSHNKYGIPIEASDWTFENEQLTVGPNEISCNVRNTSDEQMAYRFYLRLITPSGSKLSDINAGGTYDEPFTLDPDESRRIVFKAEMEEAGLWEARFVGAVMGTDPSKTVVDSYDFNVEADATRGAKLALLEAPIIENETVTNGEELTITLKIENSGADYDGRMSIRLFSKSNSTSSNNLKYEIENESVQIKAGETQDVTISGKLDIPSMTKNTALYARAYYLYGDEMMQIDEKKVTTVRVYAATGIDEVKVDDDKANDLQNAEIYNLLGKRVTLPASGQLKPGIYIINGRKRVISE